MPHISNTSVSTSLQPHLYLHYINHAAKSSATLISRDGSPDISPTLVSASLQPQCYFPYLNDAPKSSATLRSNGLAPHISPMPVSASLQPERYFTHFKHTTQGSAPLLSNDLTPQMSPTGYCSLLWTSPFQIPIMVPRTRIWSSCKHFSQTNLIANIRVLNLSTMFNALSIDLLAEQTFNKDSSRRERVIRAREDCRRGRFVRTPRRRRSFSIRFSNK